MDQADKTELLEIINSKFNSGMGVDRSDILRTKMELETAESQLRFKISNRERKKCAVYALGRYRGCVRTCVTGIDGDSSFGTSLKFKDEDYADLHSVSWPGSERVIVREETITFKRKL